MDGTLDGLTNELQIAFDAFAAACGKKSAASSAAAVETAATLADRLELMCSVLCIIDEATARQFNKIQFIDVLSNILLFANTSSRFLDVVTVTLRALGNFCEMVPGGSVVASKPPERILHPLAQYLQLPSMLVQEAALTEELLRCFYFISLTCHQPLISLRVAQHLTTLEPLFTDHHRHVLCLDTLCRVFSTARPHDLADLTPAMTALLANVRDSCRRLFDTGGNLSSSVASKDADAVSANGKPPSRHGAGNPNPSSSTGASPATSGGKIAITDNELTVLLKYMECLSFMTDRIFTHSQLILKARHTVERIIDVCLVYLNQSLRISDGRGRVLRLPAFSPLICIYMTSPSFAVPLFIRSNVYAVVCQVCLNLLSGTNEALKNAERTKSSTAAVRGSRSDNAAAAAEGGGGAGTRGGSSPSPNRHLAGGDDAITASGNSGDDETGEGFSTRDPDDTGAALTPTRGNTTTTTTNNNNASNMANGGRASPPTGTSPADGPAATPTTGPGSSADDAEEASHGLAQRLLSDDVEDVPLISEELQVIPLLEFLLTVIPPTDRAYTCFDHQNVTVPFFPWRWEDDFHNTYDCGEGLSRRVERQYQHYRYLHRIPVRRVTHGAQKVLFVDFLNMQFVNSPTMYPHSFWRSPLLQGYAHEHTAGFYTGCLCAKMPQKSETKLRRLFGGGSSSNNNNKRGEATSKKKKMKAKNNNRNGSNSPGGRGGRWSTDAGGTMDNDNVSASRAAAAFASTPRSDAGSQEASESLSHSRSHHHHHQQRSAAATSSVADVSDAAASETATSSRAHNTAAGETPLSRGLSAIIMDGPPPSSPTRSRAAASLSLPVVINDGASIENGGVNYMGDDPNGSGGRGGGTFGWCCGVSSVTDGITGGADAMRSRDAELLPLDPTNAAMRQPNGNVLDAAVAAVSDAASVTTSRGNTKKYIVTEMPPLTELLNDRCETVEMSSSAHDVYKTEDVLRRLVPLLLPALDTIIKFSVNPIIARHCTVLMLRCLAAAATSAGISVGDALKEAGLPKSTSSLSRGSKNSSSGTNIRTRSPLLAEMLHGITPAVASTLASLFIGCRSDDAAVLGAHCPFRGPCEDAVVRTGFASISVSSNFSCTTVSLRGTVQLAAAECLLLLGEFNSQYNEDLLEARLDGGHDPFNGRASTMSYHSALSATHYTPHRSNRRSQQQQYSDTSGLASSSGTTRRRGNGRGAGRTPGAGKGSGSATAANAELTKKQLRRAMAANLLRSLFSSRQREKLTDSVEALVAEVRRESEVLPLVSRETQSTVPSTKLLVPADGCPFHSSPAEKKREVLQMLATFTKTIEVESESVARGLLSDTDALPAPAQDAYKGVLSPSKFHTGMGSTACAPSSYNATQQQQQQQRYLLQGSPMTPKSSSDKKTILTGGAVAPATVESLTITAPGFDVNQNNIDSATASPTTMPAVNFTRTKEWLLSNSPVPDAQLNNGKNNKSKSGVAANPLVAPGEHRRSDSLAQIPKLTDEGAVSTPHTRNGPTTELGRLLERMEAAVREPEYVLDAAPEDVDVPAPLRPALLLWEYLQYTRRDAATLLNDGSAVMSRVAAYLRDYTAHHHGQAEQLRSDLEAAKTHSVGRSNRGGKPPASATSARRNSKSDDDDAWLKRQDAPDTLPSCVAEPLGSLWDVASHVVAEHLGVTSSDLFTYPFLSRQPARVHRRMKKNKGPAIAEECVWTPIFVHLSDISDDLIPSRAGRSPSVSAHSTGSGTTSRTHETGVRPPLYIMGEPLMYMPLDISLSQLVVLPFTTVASLSTQIAENVRMCVHRRSQQVLFVDRVDVVEDPMTTTGAGGFAAAAAAAAAAATAAPSGNAGNGRNDSNRDGGDETREATTDGAGVTFQPPPTRGTTSMDIILQGDVTTSPGSHENTPRFSMAVTSLRSPRPQSISGSASGVVTRRESNDSAAAAAAAAAASPAADTDNIHNNAENTNAPAATAAAAQDTSTHGANNAVSLPLSSADYDIMTLSAQQILLFVGDVPLLTPQMALIDALNAHEGYGTAVADENNCPLNMRDVRRAPFWQEAHEIRYAILCRPLPVKITLHGSTVCSCPHGHPAALATPLATPHAGKSTTDLSPDSSAAPRTPNDGNNNNNSSPTHDASDRIIQPRVSRRHSSSADDEADFADGTYDVVMKDTEGDAATLTPAACPITCSPAHRFQNRAQSPVHSRPTAPRSALPQGLDALLQLLAALTAALRLDPATNPDKRNSSDQRRFSSSLLHDIYGQINFFMFPTLLLAADTSSLNSTEHLSSYTLWNYPMVFPFNMRLALLRLMLSYRRVSMSTRVIRNVQHHRRTSPWSYYHGFEWLPQDDSVSVNKRLKVTLRRDCILRDGAALLRRFAWCPLQLDVCFDGEPGIGLGPALELYELLARVFDKPGANMWRLNEARDAVAAPLFPSAELSYAALTHFETLGLLLGRLLLLGRTTSLRFHPLFLQRLRGEVLAPPNDPATASANMAAVDPVVERSLQQLEAMSAEDLEASCLSFAMPGPSTMAWPAELVPGGENIPVTRDNVRAYTAAVRKRCLHEAPDTALRALRGGLVSAINPLYLTMFSASELSYLLSGAEGKLWASRAEFKRDVRASHGYTMFSEPVLLLLDLIPSWGAARQRLFLRFITGSSCMPLGGLHTPITVVRREPEVGGGGDDVSGGFQDDGESMLAATATQGNFASNASFASLQSPAGATAGEYPPSSDTISQQQQQQLRRKLQDLPTVSTCFNYLKLPRYTSREELESRLLMAITEGQGCFMLT